MERDDSKGLEGVGDESEYFDYWDKPQTAAITCRTRSDPIRNMNLLPLDFHCCVFTQD